MNVSPVLFLKRISLKRGAVFAGIMLVALLAFEVFNYSTTDFALTDLLGKELKFLGLRWATILSIAFCGIDFAGIARLFTPEQGRDEPAEVWYLFAAWLLAAAMNASLTWWGVAVAISSHTAQGSAIISREALTTGIPVFVAVMVWVIRILLIGTFSIAGERIFTFAEEHPYQRSTVNNRPPMERPRPTPITAVPQPRPAPILTTARNLAARPEVDSAVRPAPKPEPTYHPIGGMVARPRDENVNVRR